MQDELSPFHQQVQRNLAEGRISLLGMFSATPYLAGPAFLTLPVMGVFGEGDYIIAVMAGFYGALCTYGFRMRRIGTKGSAQRSRGFWIALWSFLCTVCLTAIALAFLFSGEWRPIV